MLSPTEQAAVDRMASVRPTRIEHAIAILGTHGRTRSRRGIAVVETPTAPGALLRDLLRHHLAVLLPSILSTDEAYAIARTLEASAGPEPTVDSAPVRAFGSAWFQHRGAREREYFLGAEAANRAVARTFPGVVPRLLDRFRLLVDEWVEVRSGWAGPGFLIFRPRAAAGVPGDVHFDWEGLTVDPPADLTTEAYSCVCMIQTPERGGGLRIWNVCYGVHRDNPGGPQSFDPRSMASVTIDYRVGDLVIFDSHDLHQILPMWGLLNRITLTSHLARLAEGWRTWL